MNKQMKSRKKSCDCHCHDKTPEERESARKSDEHVALYIGAFFMAMFATVIIVWLWNRP
jgi:hypothetical protein